MIGYAVLGLLLWAAPLLSIVHVESAAVVATAAFFAAGLSTLALERAGIDLRRLLLWQEGALAVPLVLLTVSALWQPNCDYVRGILFFMAFPVVTVIFAVTLAHLLHVLPLRRKRSVLISVGLLLIIVPPMFDVGFHPQFYTYNHVFGGFLGPVYDEELAVRPGLFVFRTLTVAWSVLFVGAAAWIQGSGPSTWTRMRVLIAAVLIAAAYVFAPELGFVTTYDRISDALGATRRTQHFEIHYDPARTSAEELQRIVDEHEYRYAELSSVLGLGVEEPIRSYVYPNADVRARLTGARYTSVTPVWLSVPQTHVVQPDFKEVFSHELVHVFSREFGLPMLRASLSVGLVEGLAVALEAPDGRPSPHEQVSAALLSGQLPGRSGEAAAELADVVASHLSPLGFWTGRGAVSYTTMGSFVRYLIDAYGPEPFMRAYPTASFARDYGKSPAELAREWAGAILALESVERSAAGFVAARFSVPSLFEKDCPHHVPRHRASFIEARRRLAAGDSAAAYLAAARAVAMEEGYPPALELWAALGLQHGDEGKVAERIGARDDGRMTASLYVRLGDAQALLGRTDAALGSYRRARDMLPSYAHETISLVLLREAVADAPDVLRRLVDAAPLPGAAPSFNVGGGADRPASGGTDDAATRTVDAIALARDGAYEQAIDLMRTTSASSISAAVSSLGGELARRRYVWLAAFSYWSGRAAQAAVYADSAAAEYQSVGAFNEADLLRDVRAKMTWLAKQNTEGVARRSAADPQISEVR